METVTSHAAFESTARKLSLDTAQPHLVTRVRVDDQGFNFRQGQEIFLFSKTSRLALWAYRL